MKTKKVTVWAVIISAAVIIIIILVFATSANKTEGDEQENTNIAGYDEQENMNTDGEDTINNYEGEWHRTGVGSYQWAEFTISDWKEGESFEISGDAFYGYYGGPIEGTAIFIEDDLAVLYDENVEDFLQNREGDHGIYFQFLEDSIIVTHDPYVRLWFGGGGIATAEGTYIQGEPEYTNCDDVSEIFSDDELNQIQELLGESYDNLFKNIIETGEMTEYEIDNGRLWEAYRPPYGTEWCNIIIYDDGRIYIEGQAYTGSTQFYTNSEDTEMPNIEMLKSEQPVTVDTGEIDGISLSEYVEKYVTLTDDTEIEGWEMLNHNGENILRIQVGYNQDDLRGTIQGHKEDYFIFLNGNGEGRYVLQVGYEDKWVGAACDYSAHFEDVTFDGNDDLLICLGGSRAQGYCAFIYENGQYRYEKSFENIPDYKVDVQDHVIRGSNPDSATAHTDWTFEYRNGEFVEVEEITIQ